MFPQFVPLEAVANTDGKSANTAPKKRPLSAAARRRISDAQKER